MVKTKEEIIAQFHEEVNMTVEELEAWLDDPKSTKAGTGVGIESGHKIIKILRKNPTKDPEKYDDVRGQYRVSHEFCVAMTDDATCRMIWNTCARWWGAYTRTASGDSAQHARVNRYTARHLAQEDKLKETKTREELENAKSTIRCAPAFLCSCGCGDLTIQPLSSLKNWGHVSCCVKSEPLV